MLPVLTPPLILTSLYTSQKLLNNTLYKSYKDLAFVARKKGKNIKIYQDVMRPDIFAKIRGFDTREKLGFLQLQALVGMTKFDAKDKNGNPITIETDSHGIIRKTFQKLNELGYIQNYEEKHIKDSNLVLPKLAFANTELNKKTAIYNMKFQMTEKKIDFNDPIFKRNFPMVFSQRSVLAKRGYKIVANEEGIPTIDYGNKKTKDLIEKMENTSKPKRDIKKELKVDISQREQKDKVDNFFEQQKNIDQKTNEERGD